MMQGPVFTIGHSTHKQEYFIALLRRYGITALCDVRSQPYSRANPQFNREQLRESLRESGIKYVFLGKELGGRSDDPGCYEDGKIQYDRLGQSTLFLRGLERVRQGMKKYRLALMCAEKEPLECHRAILVGRYLVANGVNVQHIHANGSVESHSDALSRLAKTLNLPEQGVFDSREELAYRSQEQRIAYDSGSAASLKPSRSRSAAR
jgi:uncharacterized protein (DUF488 family)